MFIHQIDIKTTLLLKDFLQTNDVWKLVAADFGFNTDEMNYFTAKDSVDRMWAALESRNYSVSQLEDILAVRELLRPLEILHNFVENREDNRPPSRKIANVIRSISESSVASGLSSTLSIGALVKSNLSISAREEHEDVWLNKVPFEVLKSSCNNFDEANIIGKGGFGTVYSGRMHGQDIAIKWIKKPRSCDDEDTFKWWLRQVIMELQCQVKFPAENVMPLMAVSLDLNFEERPCFVSPLMRNGSLSDRLRPTGEWKKLPILNWDQRVNIAKGTARGLTHLHAHSIYHCDIKTANILLDQHYEPRIADFGLARSWDSSRHQGSYILVSKIMGTPGFLPHDYLRSRELSYAVDTFSFGIVMFEMITGKHPLSRPPNGVSNMREIMIASTSIPRGWIDDQCLTTDASTPRINLLFDIGKRCTQELRKNRPEMEKVLDNFEASLHIETECRGDPQKIARCDNGMISSTSPDNVAPGLAWVENHFTKEKDPNHITACEDIRGPSQWDQDEIMSKESTDYNIPDMSRFD